MANIFEEFDKKVDLKEINRQKEEAAENSYEAVPVGKYIAKIESMEIGMTKDKRPMFKVQMRLVDGDGKTEKDYLSKFKKKKPCIFMNRVIFGTKNDGGMIQSVETWFNKIFPDDPIVFSTYSDFANQILDVAEDCEGFEFLVDYDDSKFNSISILEVYDA